MIEAMMLPIPDRVVDGTTSVPGVGPAVLVRDGKVVTVLFVGEAPTPPGERGFASLPLWFPLPLFPGLPSFLPPLAFALTEDGPDGGLELGGVGWKLMSGELVGGATTVTGVFLVMITVLV